MFFVFVFVLGFDFVRLSYVYTRISERSQNKHKVECLGGVGEQ